MSFPISIQATHYEEASQDESDLIGEVADSLADWAGALFKRLAAKSNIQMATNKGMFLTEDQKIMLAQNPDTNTVLLENLSDDQNSEVRNAIVANPATTNIILSKLAHDSDRFVSVQARTRISMAA